MEGVIKAKVHLEKAEATIQMESQRPLETCQEALKNDGGRYSIHKQGEQQHVEAKKQNLVIAAHPSQKVPFSYHLKDPIKTIEHTEEIVQPPLAFDLDTLKLKAIIDILATYKKTKYVPTLPVFHNIVQMMANEEMLASEA